MLISLLTLWLAVAGLDDLLKKPIEAWTLEESIEILNDSPWAQHATFTQVIGGVGSGVRGEKEILNTFYIRILSAQPIRNALARVQQINHGYDSMKGSEQRQFRELLEPGLKASMSRWIVVSVKFRSNDPERENQVTRFFETETVETLRNRAFLSTARVPRIQLRAYNPPQDDGLGARFTFPRYWSNQEIFAGPGDRLLFQLEVPQLQTPLTVAFPLDAMTFDGELIL